MINDKLDLFSRINTNNNYTLESIIKDRQSKIRKTQESIEFTLPVDMLKQIQVKRKLDTDQINESSPKKKDNVRHNTLIKRTVIKPSFKLDYLKKKSIESVSNENLLGRIINLSKRAKQDEQNDLNFKLAFFVTESTFKDNNEIVNTINLNRNMSKPSVTNNNNKSKTNIHSITKSYDSILRTELSSIINNLRVPHKINLDKVKKIGSNSYFSSYLNNKKEDSRFLPSDKKHFFTQNKLNLQKYKNIYDKTLLDRLNVIKTEIENSYEESDKEDIYQNIIQDELPKNKFKIVKHNLEVSTKKEIKISVKKNSNGGCKRVKQLLDKMSLIVKK